MGKNRTNRPTTARDPELLRSPGVDRSPAGPEYARAGLTNTHTDANPERRDERADIGMYVSLVAFPATTEDLLDGSQRNAAPDHVLDRLRDLPPNTRFSTPRDVWIALDLETTARF